MIPDPPTRAPSYSVSVCLPALDEAATIGHICRQIRDELMPDLVQELIVMDSGSRDGTRSAAASAGATVYSTSDIDPPVENGGKGEAMWKSVAVATGEILVWIDSDISNFSTSFVTRLVEPLQRDPEIAMTKGYYLRPLGRESGGGGRITELGIRPLLNLLYRPLADVVQPLSGEFALRRALALDLEFFSGYGVDIGLLFDVVETYGMEAVVQVDLGSREHDNRPLHELSRTSFEVMSALLQRLEETGHVKSTEPLGRGFRQFGIDHGAVDHRSDLLRLPAWSSRDPKIRLRP
jgi:glucosyl-3-phosphoglycerate synthase